MFARWLTLQSDTEVLLGAGKWTMQREPVADVLSWKDARLGVGKHNMLRGTEQRWLKRVEGRGFLYHVAYS